jgi:hypothetical protein
MSVACHDVSRPGHVLPRLDRMVVPRWLRERRRQQVQAASGVFAAGVAHEILRRSVPCRELTFEEIVRGQNARSFDWEQIGRDDSGPTPEEWAAFRAALAEGRRQ